ncbi:MAG: hypothetical protein OEV40_08810 [Acidimicrobiia bacterium]|nr:hypothetical protein [Acidimicrobiia bacterium]
MTSRPYVAGLMALLVVAVGCVDPPSSNDLGPSATPTAVTTETTSTTVVPALDATFAAIAERTTMTEEARRLLALSSPALVELGGLGAACGLEPEISVLGCYRSGQISVLAVTDPRLDGMAEATTAHELLHAAWATFDDAERERLSRLLQTAFDRVATTELIDRLDLYRGRDPASVDGELHSVLGTEIADVGPELETHYRRWFADRAAVVSLTVAVRATFASLEDQVDALDAALSELQARIDGLETTLDADLAALESRSAELEALLAAERFEEYNAGVGPFNEQVRLYNESVADLRTLIDDFNALARERNALAAAYTDLVAQITTSPEALPVG